MRRAGIGLALALSLVAVSSAVAQTPPRLAGAYALGFTTMCQPTLGVFKDPQGDVTGLYVRDHGEFSEVVATATFPGTGRALIVGRNVVGDALRVEGRDFHGMRDSAVSLDWAVSNTATTVTLDGLVHHARYSQIKNGIAHHVDLLAREDGRCVRRGTLSRVTP
ncbi:MAG: hypothetical protein HYR51_17385 [Candidatus Rokubacteria bacterium]|nr:hypothetical protein [Candidatus Rokubacteria bacterium]